MRLYDTPEFKQELHQTVCDWYSTRLRGLQGLVEFAEIVQLIAKDCLEHQIFLAKTPEHRFDVVAAALRAASSSAALRSAS